MEPIAPCNLLVIVGICVLSWMGFRDSRFEEKYIFWPQAILGGREYYRIVTSGFLHAGYWHLAMNMVTLYMFGNAIEWRFGGVQCLGIFFAGIIGGSLLSLFVHRHHDYRAYGASGGAVGMILAYVLLFPGSSLAPFPPFDFWVPGWLYAIGYLGLSFYGMKKQLGNIGHDAHLGGGLVGMFTAAALHPDAVRQSPWLFAGITLATLLLFVYLARNPFHLPVNIFRRPTLNRAARAYPARDQEEYKRTERRVDAILAKISAQGIQSLTLEEQTILRKTSDKYQTRAKREKPKSGLTI